MNKGLFVTFEGGEGSGKTTIISHLIEELNKLNIEYVITREPGGCDISEQIRDIILDVENTMIHKRTEALLYAASRAQHVEEVLRPALDKNKLVICDRYVDSSIIYQGYARNNSIDDIWAINNFAMDNIIPDITIFFDITPKEAFERLEKYSRQMNRLDLEDISFHNEVYDAYMVLAKQDRFVKVDATKSIEEVVADVYKIVYSEITKRGLCE
ncbi:MAG: dTMP kinase [Bacilli bacterium]